MLNAPKFDKASAPQALIFVVAMLCGLAMLLPLSEAQTPPKTDAAPRTNIAVSATAASQGSRDKTAVVFDVTVRNDGPDIAELVILEAIVDDRILARLKNPRMQSRQKVRCYPNSFVCELGNIQPSEKVRISVSAELIGSIKGMSIGMEFRAASPTVDVMPFDNRYYSATFVRNE